MYQGVPPTDGQSVEVIIKNFEFIEDRCSRTTSSKRSRRPRSAPDLSTFRDRSRFTARCACSPRAGGNVHCLMRADAAEAGRMEQLEITRSRIETAERLIRPYVRRTPVLTIDARELGLEGGPAHAQVRADAALGLVQGARRVRQPADAARCPSGASSAAVGRQSRASRSRTPRGRSACGRRSSCRACPRPPRSSASADYGADLEVGGAAYAEALAASELWQARSGALPVHAFDQVETLLGTGTRRARIRAAAAGARHGAGGVGGGGLIGGIASWYAGARAWSAWSPRTAPTLTYALAAGRAPWSARSAASRRTRSRRGSSAP
jgi:hypothetical protein